MNTQKKAFCYNDVVDSYKAGIDYNKIQKSTVLVFSNLKEKSTSEYITKESKQGIEYVSNAEGETKSQRLEEGSNEIFDCFKYFIGGAMFGCAVVIIVSHFLYKMMN